MRILFSRAAFQLILQLLQTCCARHILFLVRFRPGQGFETGDPGLVQDCCHLGTNALILVRLSSRHSFVSRAGSSGNASTSICFTHRNNHRTIRDDFIH